MSNISETQYPKSGENYVACFDPVCVPGFVSYPDLQMEWLIRKFLWTTCLLSQTDPIRKEEHWPIRPHSRDSDHRGPDGWCDMDAGGPEGTALLGLSERGPMSIVF